jgi:hypothetical protein
MKNSVTTTMELENIRMTVSATVERADYGVGTSNDFDIEDIRIEGVEILGVAVDPAILPDLLIRDLKALAQHADFLECV